MKKFLLIIFLLPFFGFAQVIPGGTYVIGASQPNPYKTLVSAIARVNTSGISGPVTFLLDENQNVTSQITINQFTGTSAVNKLTIKPNTGKNITISGNVNNAAVIGLNGADNIVVDGNNTISDNMLTIYNTNNFGYDQRAGMRLYNTAVGNIVQNLIVKMEIAGLTTGIPSVGIYSGGNSIGNSGNNSNNNILNTTFVDVKQAIIVNGSNVSSNKNWVIQNNKIGSSDNNHKPFLGIYIKNVSDYEISNNTIDGVRFPSGLGGSTEHSGVFLDGANNGIIRNNIISNITSEGNSKGHAIYVIGNDNQIFQNYIKDLNSSSSTDGSYGIKLEGNNTTIYRNDIANIFSSQAKNTNGIYISGNNQLVYNNFVNDVKSAGGGEPNAQSGIGIYINSGNNIRLYYNSVLLKTNQDTGISAALFIKGGSQLDIRNNIFVNNQTSGATSFAIYSEVTNFDSSYILDYNDYYSTQYIGSLGSYYTSTNIKTSLPNWKSATGKDAHSINFNPVFVSGTDLHLQDISSNVTNLKKGIPITNITTDIDEDTRATGTASPEQPYIGADEIKCTPPTISGTLNVCVNGTTTLTGSGTPNATTPWSSASTSVATVSSTGVVTGVSAGTSVITYRNNNGCSVTTTVTVNALPTITGTLNTCVNGTTSLTGSGTPNSTNPWSSASTSVATVSNTGVVTGVSAGTSVITYRNSNGCSVTTTVTVNALPTITGTLNTCVNGITSLTGSGTPNATNPWTSASHSVATVSNTGVVTGVSAGTSVITYRNSNGCSVTVTVTVNPLPTTSNAGLDQANANATSFTLAANTPTVGTGVWTIVSGPSTSLNQFSSTTNPTATFTPSPAGTYVLNWLISNGTCSSQDQVVITNSCVSNLLSSGDFTGNNSVWTPATTQGNSTEIYPESIYFSNSNNSLAAELDRDASLRQVVTVIPGVSYTVSFRYARRPTNGVPATTGVTVKITGGTSDIISTGFTTTNTTSKTDTFTFTPTSSSIGVEFYNTLHGNTTVGTIIDDIVLLPASQPNPYAVTNPRGTFNTSTACAGASVQLDVENAPVLGAIYSWTGTAGAVFSSTNIKNPTITFAGSGVQQATVTVTSAAGCFTSSTTYVNVTAAPVITAPVASSVCSGATYTSGAITSTGATFDWSRAAVAGINGGVASTGGTNIAKATGFTEVLTNATNAPINVTYVLTPRWSTNSCAGIPYNLVVTVNPRPSAPVVGTITQPNCSVLTGSVNLSGLPSTGNWTVTRIPGNVETTGTGGSTIISGLDPGSYTFTVSSGSCTSGSSDPVNVVAFSRATVIWNGSYWSATPTIEDRVEFRGLYNSDANLPNGEKVLNACSCYVDDNSAVVTFKEGHTLNVINEVQVLSGSLTFENNASLVQKNEGPNINSGNINYHRHTASVKRYDYTYWSSPVAGQTMHDLSPLTFYDKYYSYNDKWLVNKNGTLEMEKGEGYIIRAPQDHEINTAKVDKTPVFKGVPNNGKIEKLLTGGKLYLLGNPYPSALDADAFLDLNSKLDLNKRVLEGTLYFWTHNTPPSDKIDGDKKYNYTTADYATYNKTGGVGTTPKVAGAVPTGGEAPTGKIAAGQGFFAPASTKGGTLEFNNTMRVVDGTNGTNNSQFFKLSTAKTATAAVAKIEKSRIWLNLTNNEGAFKQTLIGYITGATNEYDGTFDGVSYDGNAFVDFYSVNDEKNLTIQGRALPFVKKDSVALGYKSTIIGDFQISIDQTDGVLSTENVFLEDKDLKVLHDLKKEAYTFSTQKGTFNNRFVLRYVDKNIVDEVIVPETPGQESNAAVIVSVKDGEIKINATVTKLDKVVVYDMAGRKLFQKNKVDANVFFISRLVWNHQALVVDIVLTDGTKHSRKIIN